MDIMICREVLDNLIDGCKELGIEQENIARWQEQRERLLLICWTRKAAEGMGMARLR